MAGRRCAVPGQIDPDVSTLRFVDLPEIEQRLRELAAAIPSPGAAELLRGLTIRDDAERAREIGELYRGGILPRRRPNC